MSMRITAGCGGPLRQDRIKRIARLTPRRSKCSSAVGGSGSGGSAAPQNCPMSQPGGKLWSPETLIPGGNRTAVVNRPVCPREKMGALEIKPHLRGTVDLGQMFQTPAVDKSHPGVEVTNDDHVEALSAEEQEWVVFIVQHLKLATSLIVLQNSPPKCLHRCP